VCAFLALFSSNKYVRDAALGNSEPLLAAVVLWAFERHLDGRRDHALYLGVLAALLRPEAWPFLGLYGLWLWFRDPRLRARLVAFAALIPALWFLPEWWGSGDPLRDYYLGGTQVAFDAIETIRRQLSVELGPHGIRVVTLESGGVPESLPEGFEGREGIVELIEGQTLLGRGATLEDVGNAAVFAASGWARSMTASTGNGSSGARID
jgi:hypothetical protein